MKNLKLKSKLLGLLIMSIVSVFVTSCEQSEVITLDTPQVVNTNIGNIEGDNMPDINTGIVSRDVIPFILNDSFGAAPELLCNLTEPGKLYTNLYNTGGQHIRTLYEAEVTKGEFRISVGQGKLPRGMYFIYVNFVSTDGTETNKVFKVVI